jgi:DNA-directed RNA polymerase specialized sigma24 family protein
MSEGHTVTGWVAEICAGNEDAARKLVELYLKRLVRLGNQTYERTFGKVPRPAEDEEDAALSALDSFCARARAGKVHDLANRNQLWKLLVTITVRKIYDQRKRATALKRGGTDGQGAAAGVEQAISKLPAPDAQAELADTYRAAMDALDGDPELTKIAEMELEGRTRAEIAKALGLTDRTIYRKLQVIHDQWNRFFASAQ